MGSVPIIEAKRRLPLQPAELRPRPFWLVNALLKTLDFPRARPKITSMAAAGHFALGLGAPTEHSPKWLCKGGATKPKGKMAAALRVEAAAGHPLCCSLSRGSLDTLPRERLAGWPAGALNSHIRNFQTGS